MSSFCVAVGSVFLSDTGVWVSVGGAVEPAAARINKDTILLWVCIGAIRNKAQGVIDTVKPVLRDHTMLAVEPTFLHIVMSSGTTCLKSKYRG